MRLHYDQEANAFHAFATYAERYIPGKAGFRWNKPKKLWETSSRDHAMTLIDYADDACREYLQDDAYRERMDAQRRRAEALRETSRATTTDFHVPAGGGREFLPYQLAGIEQAIARPNILIADEMGLGKTAQAIGVINAVPEIRNVLIVATASLANNWAREIDKFSTREDLSVGFATTKGMSGAPIKITTYDVFSRENNVRRLLREMAWDLLILDECHYLKNKDASRTQHILGHRGIQAIQATRTICLTGTPLLNRPIEIWTVAHALCPESFPEYFRFAERYCDGHEGRYGYDAKGATNLDELNRLLTGTIMVRRRKADVLTNLPAKIRQIIELPARSQEEKDALTNEKRTREKQAQAKKVNAKIQAQIKALKAQKASTSSEDYAEQVRELEASTEEVHFNEIAIARHETALAKLPQTIEVISDILEQDDDKKLIVFAHHKDVVSGLAQGLERFGTVQITGETPPATRMGIVDEFQADGGPRVFIGSIHACAEGLTLTRANHVVFVEIDWTPAKMTQAEDRAHRIGQASSVLVQHLLLEGSYDAEMAYIIAEKQLVIDEVVN